MIFRGLTSHLALASARYGDMVAFRKQNLAAHQRVLGIDHPDTLATRNNLGLVLHTALRELYAGR